MTPAPWGRSHPREYWHSVGKMVVGIVFVYVVAILLIYGCSPASSQGRLQSVRPQGYFGVGHAEHHAHYKGLRNAYNGSCCDGSDCRPTQAKWDYGLSTWQVMVDGKWRVIDPMFSGIIISDEVFARQGRERWDSLAHVCTSLNGTTIYCVILPGSGG